MSKTEWVLRLILEKSGKDWEWLEDYVYHDLGFDIYTDCFKDIFEKYPKLLILLVIDLAEELWKDKCHLREKNIKCLNYNKRECPLLNIKEKCDYIIDIKNNKILKFINIPEEKRVDWLLKELR
jgi:hypothetical protein